MRKPLAYVSLIIIGCVIFAGAIFPDSMDWLLPASMRYAFWPVWLKVVGWLCVALVFIATLITSTGRRAAQVDKK